MTKSLIPYGKSGHWLYKSPDYISTKKLTQSVKYFQFMTSNNWSDHLHPISNAKVMKRNGCIYKLLSHCSQVLCQQPQVRTWMSLHLSISMCFLIYLVFVYLFTLSIQTKDSATEQEKIPLKPIIWDCWLLSISWQVAQNQQLQQHYIDIAWLYHRWQAQRQEQELEFHIC